MNCNSHISATPPSRSKPSRPIRSTGASRTVAKNWATAYDFPAVTDKRVLKEEFPIRNLGIMQAFVFNLRREKFQDPRVRLAFNYAFDFEEMNKQMFFGSYKRIASYFDGTDLAATGLPTGRELELLETVRDKVPPELFKKPYHESDQRHARAVRDNLREALRLLKDGGLRDSRPATGQRQDRRALHRRTSRRRIRASSASSCSTSLRSNGSA